MKNVTAGVGLVIVAVGIAVLLKPDLVVHPLLTLALQTSTLWPATVLIVTGAAMVTLVFVREWMEPQRRDMDL